MSELQRPQSISSPRPSLRVANSPFNGLKLFLVIFLLGGVPLWWAVGTLTPIVQLLVLGAYGLTGSLWVAMRTRRILRERAHGTE